MLIAGGRCQVGFGLAGSIVTIRLDGHLMHAIAVGVLIGTCPILASQTAKLPAARAASTPLPPLHAGLSSSWRAAGYRCPHQGWPK
jgi:hypothetical protein